MNPILLSFSFLTGIQAFFAPCSIALIPAYVGYYVREETGGHNRIQQLLFGLKAGSFASLGLISVYVVFGLVLALLGEIIAPYVSWVELITGGVLLFLGTATLLGYEFALRPPVVIQTRTNGAKRFYFFGLAYALGAIGCTLPIFLLVIFQALAQGGFVGGLTTFLVYSLAMVLLMIVFSLIAAVSKNAISRFMNRYMTVIQKSAGALILFAGVYLVYLALRVITI
ncbi:hypothetical protein COU87_03560 [Candidatus Roizmanbacteria bacterium CG10_big_fil_rev_8_21_14_0_10_39_12]|uniref:Uncharacterized protein n=1 Tax=Candidatus Roizmanbacteria bacterium CG10_big_fil_rev_8_21_14_0_10_39_12 TaxID=1974852 RepID=A0A2M8KNZ6_9BACT|nr:MAG: hypothetical protein COU87_03560 [Candidatus Roizmanbacteria bacterium CG10_big_fil_rev_8_21_14_0_10_39_12]